MGRNLGDGDGTFGLEIAFYGAMPFDVEIAHHEVLADSSAPNLVQVEAQWHEARKVMEDLLRGI